MSLCMIHVGTEKLLLIILG